MTLPDRPKNIGIKAFQIYIPGQAVSQSALEQHDGVSAGKYTIGLGQTNMAFVNDREDTYSLALTVTKALLDDYGIDPASIGRLEVGTETLLDKSKSVKSVLMQLFGENTDIEGLDSINACYGGTNALFNAINWVESSTWDGRNAIVVAVDIAIYAKGAARSTGGAGAVAFLVGPDASIVFDPIHGSHMEHVYDFYKPDFTSEYPVVDGHFSLTCYTRALDRAYEAYNGKAVRLGFDFAKDATLTGMDRFDYSVFHVPTCKLVSKCYARLHYIDYRQDASLYAVQESIKNLDYETSLTDKSVEKTFLDLVKEKAKKRLGPGIFGPTNTGNMYTASLYSSLASLLSNVPTEELRGKRISLYSYGSGLAASFFSCVVKENVSVIAEKLQLKQKLAQREIVTPKAYEAAIAFRERANLRKGYKPEGAIEHIPQGAYYLIEVDDKFRRFYAVKG